MIDIGTGPPLVLIPGVQGRWEWMAPTVDALAREFRVITSSLPGEPGSFTSSNGVSGFEAYIAYVDALLDAKNIPSAVICGVSLGGLVALRYAARRPERVRALILVSTPGPHWIPEPHQQQYMRTPLLSSPAFAINAVLRAWRELRVTYPELSGRLKFCAATVRRLIQAPAAPWRMAARARMAAGEQFDHDCANIKAPTLVIAGERDLDRVIRQSESMRYVTAIKGARFQLFEKTGHLGTISAPTQFAAMVSQFLNG
jgi:pimeloyl-ACP methyl ester carboxylesterase